MQSDFQNGRVESKFTLVVCLHSYIICLKCHNYIRPFNIWMVSSNGLMCGRVSSYLTKKKKYIVSIFTFYVFILSYPKRLECNYQICHKVTRNDNVEFTSKNHVRLHWGCNLHKIPLILKSIIKFG